MVDSDNVDHCGRWLVMTSYLSA